MQLFNEKSAHTVNTIRQREKKEMRKQRAPPGEEVDSTEVSEKLKHFNSMTDKKKVNKRENRGKKCG